MTKFTAIALLIALASPAYAVDNNPGQTDPNPTPETDAASPGPGPEPEGGSGAVRWSPERRDYNLIPSFNCVSMHCDEAQGGDR